MSRTENLEPETKSNVDQNSEVQARRGQGIPDLDVQLRKPLYLTRRDGAWSRINVNRGLEEVRKASLIGYATSITRVPYTKVGSELSKMDQNSSGAWLRD